MDIEYVHAGSRVTMGVPCDTTVGLLLLQEVLLEAQSDSLGCTSAPQKVSESSSARPQLVRVYGANGRDVCLSD